jgi:ParB family transcriptional regulator, chromosome partitioning protein
MTKKALGRGLDALISAGITTTIAAETPRMPITVRPLGATSNDEPVIRQIDIGAIDRSRFQPRTDFDAEQLRELADSIKQRGVMQPLLVRPVNGAGRYELIAGERRWRAAREAGLATVPALVREASDEEALEIALIENLQREDLNPVEEARAYEQLATRFNLTQEQIAEKVGRSRAAVANSLRLLTLHSEALTWVADGRLSVGHAKAILGLSIAEEQRIVAERVLRQNLTVRETEQLVEQIKTGKRHAKSASGATIKSTEVIAIEEKLQQKLATRVTLYHGKKKGRIEIEYFGNDDLARVLAILGIENL